MRLEHAAGPHGSYPTESRSLEPPTVRRGTQSAGAWEGALVMHPLDPVPPPASDSPMAVRFALWCGMPPLARLIMERLIPLGFVFDPQADTLALIDAPIGFALQTLDTHDLAARLIIVATSSPCPEYWADLSTYDPAILLVGTELDAPLAAALEQVAHGARYQRLPPVQSPLTAQERTVLRAVARGYTNDQIAQRMGLSPKRVANLLTAIYAKLQLPNRVALALYYWGRSDLLAVNPEAPPT